MKYIDLTHPISPTIPTWDGSCGFELIVATDYSDCTAPDLFRVHTMKTRAGIGTHMDAPAHCIPDAQTIESIQLEQLVTACVVIKIETKGDERYSISPARIEEFEQVNGRIPEGSFVIFHTGWDTRWNTPELYHNNHIFPSVHIDTAQILLKRNVVGLGIDTLSSDTGHDGFPVHRAFLGAGKYLVENIAHAGQLPPFGAQIFVMPMKMQDATEAPVRLIAAL